jgi:hypothetical protein
MNESRIRISFADWENQHSLILRFDLIPGAFRSTLLNHSYSR